MTATYSITYNGHLLVEPTVDEFTSEPVYAEDELSLISRRHVIRGTAWLTAATSTAFEAAYEAAEKELGVPRGNLTIIVNDNVAGGNRTLVSVDAPDQFDGPKGSFKITKMIGARAAQIAFEVIWHEYIPESGTVQDVLSHRWKAAYDLDANGMTVRTVAGTIVLRANTSPTTAGVVSKPIVDEWMVGKNPDAYRLVITPDLPKGFRRETMQYAIDETGNRLLYVIVDKQFALDLPAPATSGEGSFEWSASLNDNLMGRKVFEVTLTGPTNVTTADLLKAAVLMSKSRVKWGPGQAEGGSAVGSDLIESIRVEEPNIFASNTITFRVTTRTVKSGEDVFAMPNTSLLSDFLEGLSDRYSDISPYGSAAIRSVHRTLRLPTYTTIDKHTDESVLEADTVATTAYVFTDRDFDAVESGLVVRGSQSESSVTTAAHNQNPYVDVAMAERMDVVDTGLVAIGSRSSTSPTKIFQVRDPVVFYTSVQRISRVGKAPTREMVKPPPFGMLVMERFWTHEPRDDPNGNRVFTATFVRVVQLVKGGAGFSVDGGGRVRFRPPTATVRLPFDPRTESPGALAQNIFAAVTDRVVGSGIPSDLVT